MTEDAPGAIRLIVNADDFGRSPGVNRGIVEARRAGIVTSTSLMANLPWAEDAVERAGDVSDWSAGLHLTWCYGSPVSPLVPSLLGPDGRLNRDLVALAKSATEIEVEREARAQLARFVDLTGRLPSHLDSHLHLHAWPICRGPVIRIAREFRLPVRCADPPLAAALRDACVETTDAFVNAFFAPGQLTRSRLFAVIAEMRPGVTELMVHPGYEDDALSDSSFRAQRETELAILTRPDVRAEIERRGITLVDWTAVGPSRSTV